jgi:hypothetical protein
LESPNNLKKLDELYGILLNHLNENNNNYVSSQINLISNLIKKQGNSENLKTFTKNALPKLFGKFYLQNSKINENLIKYLII